MSKDLIEIFNKMIEKIDQCENTLDADLYGKINIWNELIKELEEE